MVDLTGRFVPLVSPFTDDGAALSEVRLARLIRHFVQGGAEGFVLATDVGEFTTMSFSERKELVELTIRDTQNALPILAHVSTLSTSASIDLAQHAVRHGARGVIAMPPYYGVNNQKEISEHLKAIASYGRASLMVVDPLSYLTPETRKELAEQPEIGIATACPGWSSSFSDCFSLGSLTVNVMDWLPSATIKMLLGHSHAAVAKALLEEIGLEVGRPRMPAQPLLAGELGRAA